MSYHESDLSQSARAATRAMTDDELLSMVQEACFRYYWDAAHPNAGMAREIRETATRFWRTVEWDWYRKSPEGAVLYWHWSPNHGFHINHPLIGWNETMIVYLLAIASPTHPVPATLYHTSWAGQSEQAVEYRRGWGRTRDGDHYVNGNSYYGIKLDVGVGSGAELSSPTSRSWDSTRVTSETVTPTTSRTTATSR